MKAECILVVLNAVLVWGDNMLGDGIWSVKHMSKCAEDAMFKNKFEVEQHRVNRTHDAFNLTMYIEEAIDDTYSIRIDVCKYCDGGCKPYQVIADDSIARFVAKYAEGNMRTVQQMCGMDPDGSLIQEGTWEMADYMIDFCELPEQAVFGEFGAQVFIVKGAQDVACIDVECAFARDDDDKCGRNAKE